MSKLIINESEKSHILNMYESTNDDFVITDWLSPDENYVVFLDDLYDVKNKVKLGNIWEDYNTLKIFLHHTFSTSNLSKQLKENAENVLNNKLLLEGKQNLNELKSAVKILVNEGLLSSFKDWVIKTGKSTVDGFVNFAKDTYKGAKAIISAISKGEWKEVFKLLGMGVLYLFRKVRSAMYHPVGMILDAILIAVGVATAGAGKVVQMVLWGIIVALDIYEMISGDYEEPAPTWQRLLFLGVDIIGLVTAGAVAKPLKVAVTGAKDIGTFAKTPIGKKALTSMLGAAEKAPGLVKQVASYLSKTFPKGAKFINGILGRLGSFVDSLIKTISTALGKTGTKTVANAGKYNVKAGVKAGLTTGGLVAGIGTGVEYYKEKKQGEIQNAMASNTTQGTYDINNI
jgi:hypothetical protein